MKIDNSTEWKQVAAQLSSGRSKPILRTVASDTESYFAITEHEMNKYFSRYRTTFSKLIMFVCLFPLPICHSLLPRPCTKILLHALSNVQSSPYGTRIHPFVIMP